MHGAMDRIDLDGGGYVESCLLEAEAKPAGASEEVDSDGSHGAEVRSSVSFSAILAPSALVTWN